MKDAIKEYKEMICPECKHYRDDSYQECEIRKCIDNTIKCVKYEKRRKMKKERFEIDDELIFTGQDYNIAKIYNYAQIFKDKKLIIESIQRCPCEENKNDKIKFKGIERLLSLYIF